VEGPFDAVIGSSVLHHLEIEEAVPKIYALLKPGSAAQVCGTKYAEAADIY
jgi:2-polyprenyl-3-methyl-5-hydroxy-6-metoxy-1,4-benzoquinol methylase